MTSDISSAGKAHIVVRLLRSWVLAREGDLPQMPVLVTKASERGLGPDTAIACASLFELVEGQLHRHLVPECCCSLAMSPDELAVMALLRHVHVAGAVRTSRAVPHGLSGALIWAAYAVNGSLGPDDNAAKDHDSRSGACPFAQGGAVMKDMPMLKTAA